MAREKTTHIPSRRTFLAASLSATALGVTATSAAELTKRGAGANSNQTDYDVIVVGGGFSGVTAARDLSKNGLRVLLLEAKGRLGGRTFDTHFRGHHIELGGTWVHWTQPAVWTEIQRYGMALEETPGSAPDRMTILSDGTRTEFQTLSRIEELVVGLESYFSESGAVWERPYDSKFHWKEIVARDSQSAADRLNALKATELQRGYLVPLLEAFSHCPIDQASYVDLLRIWALCLNNPIVANDAISRYKLTDGTGALIRFMAGDSRADVRLNSPVARVEQRKDIVQVTARGGAPISARALVLALPPRVLASIEFTPALSAGKVSASREAYPPSGTKLYAEVKGRLGKLEWMSSGRASQSGLFTTYAEGKDSTLLVGFCPTTKQVDANDEESVQKLLRIFDPRVEVLGCASYAWSKDPYAQGTYTGMRPGGMSRWFDELARTEGLVYMAGGDVGDGSWRGCIDGAIGRGARIARELSTRMLG